MMGMQLIEQDSTCRPVSENGLGNEGSAEPEERTRERLIATTRANWLHSSRDRQGRSGECSAAA